MIAPPFFVSPLVVQLERLPTAKPHGPIAQLAEHRADNAGVSGAIPLRPTKFSAIVIERLFFEFEPLQLLQGVSR